MEKWQRCKKLHSRGNWTRISQDIYNDKRIFLGCSYVNKLIAIVIDLFLKCILESVIYIQYILKLKYVEDFVQLPLLHDKDLGHMNFQE